ALGPVDHQPAITGQPKTVVPTLRPVPVVAEDQALRPDPPLPLLSLKTLPIAQGVVPKAHPQPYFQPLRTVALVVAVGSTDLRRLDIPPVGQPLIHLTIGLGPPSEAHLVQPFVDSLDSDLVLLSDLCVRLAQVVELDQQRIGQTCVNGHLMSLMGVGTCSSPFPPGRLPGQQCQRIEERAKQAPVSTCETDHTSSRSLAFLFGNHLSLQTLLYGPQIDLGVLERGRALPGRHRATQACSWAPPDQTLTFGQRRCPDQPILGVIRVSFLPRLSQTLVK